jgi:hypothetical protein
VKRISHLLIGLILVAFAAAQDSLPGNEAVVDTLFNRMLDSLRVANAFDSAGVVLQLEHLNPEKQAYCKTRLLAYLTKHEIPVLQHGAKGILAIEEMRVRVTYGETPTAVLGLRAKVNRRISLTIKGWVQRNGTGKQIYLQGSRRHSDTVSKAQIPRLEESPYVFVRGKWVSFSRWTRFLQPAILFGSLSALIYLFYTLRT